MRQSVRFAAWAAAAAILGYAVAAFAQVSFVGSPYIPLPNGAEAYLKQSPVTGSTMAFTKGVSEMQVGGSSTIGALTIDLNTSPYDGQMNCFYTKPIVTALTLVAASGQTLNDAVTATAATTRYCYLFSNSNQSWDRVQ